MVVAVGLTLVEPLAELEVKVPGVIATLVAPVTDQLNMLLEPEAMLTAFAVKEVIVGLLGGSAVTFTVTVEVVEPVLLVAVRV